MKIIALAILLLTATPIWAGGLDSGIVINLTSRHFNAYTPMNEDNKGVGIRYTVGSTFYMAGTYLNSINKQSVYAGAGWSLYTAGPLRFTVLAGIVTGYAMPVQPVLLP